MTKEIKHTPGPWIIDGPRQFNDDLAIKDHDGVLHIAHITKDSADFADGHFEIDESEQLANANLIAAAPALLSALSDLIIWNDVNHPEHDAMVEREYEHAIATEKHTTAGRVRQRLLNAARAAIAKAKGEKVS